MVRLYRKGESGDHNFGVGTLILTVEKDGPSPDAIYWHIQGVK
jgi:hypothetical protein